MLNFSANLSMLFTEVPLIERFALAKQAGFNAVEIQFPYALSKAQIKQQLDTHALKLVLINVPAGDLMQGGDGLACLPDKQTDFKEALALAKDYASYLEVPCVNILAGRQPTHLSEEATTQVLLENINTALQILAPQGIFTVLEAINGIDMPRFKIQTLEAALAIHAHTNHPAFGLQYDCYHMAMMGENVLARLQQHIQHIQHIQFAGFKGRHEPNTGSLDYAPIFNWLAQSGYTGYCGAEYRPAKDTLSGLATWFAPYLS